MGPTSSAPVGGAGRPLGPPALPGGYRPPPPVTRPLTAAQRSRLATTAVVLVVLGAALGLLATAVLPHVYAAQASIRYSLGRGAGDSADRVLATQTVLITGREVLQPVADTLGIPITYLMTHTTAAVAPNSEIIQVQVRHSNRATGVQIADAVAKRYIELAESTGPRAAVTTQLNDLQRQLTSPTTPALQLPALRLRVAAVQAQLDDLATTENLASIASPAYSLPDAVFPNTLVTIGVGTLLGVIVAAFAASIQVRRFRREY